MWKPLARFAKKSAAKLTGKTAVKLTVKGFAAVPLGATGKENVGHTVSSISHTDVPMEYNASSDIGLRKSEDCVKIKSSKKGFSLSRFFKNCCKSHKVTQINGFVKLDTASYDLHGAKRLNVQLFSVQKMEQTSKKESESSVQRWWTDEARHTESFAAEENIPEKEDVTHCVTIYQQEDIVGFPVSCEGYDERYPIDQVYLDYILKKEDVHRLSCLDIASSGEETQALTRSISFGSLPFNIAMLALRGGEISLLSISQEYIFQSDPLRIEKDLFENEELEVFHPSVQKELSSSCDVEIRDNQCITSVTEKHSLGLLHPYDDILSDDEMIDIQCKPTRHISEIICGKMEVWKTGKHDVAFLPSSDKLESSFKSNSANTILQPPKDIRLDHKTVVMSKLGLREKELKILADISRSPNVNFRDMELELLQDVSSSSTKVENTSKSDGDLDDVCLEKRRTMPIQATVHCQVILTKIPIPQTGNVKVDLGEPKVDFANSERVTCQPYKGCKYKKPDNFHDREEAKKLQGHRIKNIKKNHGEEQRSHNDCFFISSWKSTGKRHQESIICHLIPRLASLFKTNKRIVSFALLLCGLDVTNAENISATTVADSSFNILKQQFAASVAVIVAICCVICVLRVIVQHNAAAANVVASEQALQEVVVDNHTVQGPPRQANAAATDVVDAGQVPQEVVLGNEIVPGPPRQGDVDAEAAPVLQPPLAEARPIQVTDPPPEGQVIHRIRRGETVAVQCHEDLIAAGIPTYEDYGVFAPGEGHFIDLH